MISLLVNTLAICLLAASTCLAHIEHRYERDLEYADAPHPHQRPSPFAHQQQHRRSVDDEEDFEEPQPMFRRSIQNTEDAYHRPQRRSVYSDKIKAQRRRAIDNAIDRHQDMLDQVADAEAHMTRRETNPAANANNWHNAAHAAPSAGADFAHHQHESAEEHASHEHDRRSIHERAVVEPRSRRHLIMPGPFYGGYGYPAFGYPGFYGGYGYPGYGGLYFRRRREIPLSDATFSPVSPVYSKPSDSAKSMRRRRSLAKPSPFDRVKTHQRRQVPIAADPLMTGGLVGAPGYIGAPVVGAGYVDPLAGGFAAPGYVAPGYIGAPVVGAGLPLAGVL